MRLLHYLGRLLDPRTAGHRFNVWVHAPLTIRRLQRQILTVSVALLIVSFVTGYAFSRIYSLQGDLREAAINACERGNPVREAVRNSAAAVGDLIVAVNVPPSPESVRNFNRLRDYVLDNPQDPTAVYVYHQVRVQYEDRHRGAVAFETALRNLNDVQQQAAPVANCADIVKAEN